MRKVFSSFFVKSEPGLLLSVPSCNTCLLHPFSSVFKTITVIYHLISGPSGNSSLHFQLSSVYYFSEQKAHNQEDTRRMGFVASPVGKMKISVVVNHVILGLAVKSKLCKQANLYSPELYCFCSQQQPTQLWENPPLSFNWSVWKIPLRVNFLNKLLISCF